MLAFLTTRPITLQIAVSGGCNTRTHLHPAVAVTFAKHIVQCIAAHEQAVRLGQMDL